MDLTGDGAPSRISRLVPAHMAERAAVCGLEQPHVNRGARVGQRRVGQHRARR